MIDLSQFSGGKSPGEVLRSLLDQRGWTQDELALIMGCSRQSVHSLCADKVGITASMAVALAAAFNIPAILWMQLDMKYRIRRAEAEGDSREVEQRASLFRRVPVRDMQRRGWIAETNDVSRIESEIKRFFRIQSLDERGTLSVSLRRTASDDGLTPAQAAWCMRARQLAETVQVAPFTPDCIAPLKRALRKLAAYPKEARHIPVVCAEHGVRFAVIEPLPGAKIDGAAFWLDAQRPAISVSVRFDRIDGFWHTLFHEVAHIEHGDALSVDVDFNERDVIGVQAEAESRADAKAAADLVPQDELKSFILRVGPLYSSDRIVQFAHKVKMHPGVIVGQLQHKGELGYSALREFLVKIRGIVTETALTDGWGRSINLDVV